MTSSDAGALVPALRALVGDRISGLVDRGVHICETFDPSENVYCKRCGYSADTHLIRNLAALLHAAETPAEPPDNGFLGALAPAPPETEAETLTRYGIEWRGEHEPIGVPMSDGYWTPWHVADALVARWREELADEQAHEAYTMRLLKSAEREIAEAREACPCVRQDRFADASLLKAVNEEVSRSFRYQSRAEQAEATCARSEAFLVAHYNEEELYIVTEHGKEKAKLEATCARLEADLAAVREAMTWMDRKGGLGLDVHERIRVALAAAPSAPQKETP